MLDDETFHAGGNKNFIHIPAAVNIMVQKQRTREEHPESVKSEYDILKYAVEILLGGIVVILKRIRH